MALYKLPLGIRIPKDNEYPDGYDVKSINDKRNSANIVEGFTIKEVVGEKFSHYVEINVDVDKIWSLFCSLTRNLINDVAYGIIGFKEEEPTLSKFSKLEKIISIFQKYEFELVNDGCLEFGIANYNENSLNEIFITSFKYIKIWTNNKEGLIDVLNSFEIQEIENLQFIDEFPVVSQALSNSFNKEIRHYSEVIECIEREFFDL
ncbi:hypothetical protein SAMN02745163_02953 [Clostridium cavendishii DSM 21758]|uniref:Uncharacterized protein n=1 Tax=Clostridium cavendishii DSM 21758 TaxID=1121302 RepID=A0A1M6NMF9_9CLOT|nr:hypothetical protein [Clostridium cavendishii]SHJ96937.1 hypothetical protein SAMN02745163_02953 [Clostridium cavendishii DSM 21758]